MTLAGLALQTSRIRLGTLVTAATFRLPGPLAISVAQVDQMSGGRVEFGMGAGWFEAEHTAYAIPFPACRAVRPVRGTPRDRHRAVGNPPGEDVLLRRDLLPGRRFPRAAQARPAAEAPRHPGRYRTRRTPGLAARYADEFNMAFQGRQPPRRVRPGPGRLHRGRAGPVLDAVLGGQDGVLRPGRRRGGAPRRGHRPGGRWQGMRANGDLAGTPAQIVDAIGGYARAGAGTIYLQVLDLSDLDHLELLAAEVMPQV